MTEARELVNISQAAQRSGRPRTTISDWVRRGLLFPVGLEHDNTPLYDLADVRKIAARRPQRRRRTKGSTRA